MPIKMRPILDKFGAIIIEKIIINKQIIAQKAITIDS